MEIVEDLLAFRIPVFTRRARRHMVAHPKFYFADAGVFQSLPPAGPLDSSERAQGGALEGLVDQHRRAWLSYSRSSARVYYWRTRAGSEVDFVVYGEDESWALEVKHSRRVRLSDLRHLRPALVLLAEETSVSKWLESYACLRSSCCRGWSRGAGCPDVCTDSVGAWTAWTRLAGRVTAAIWRQRSRTRRSCRDDTPSGRLAGFSFAESG